MTKARNNKVKLNNIISVSDYGVVGDGVADDTVAIQNAFTAAANGGTVRFAKGATYRITLTLTGNNISLEGNDATIVSDGDFRQIKLADLRSTAAVSLAVTQYQRAIDFGADYGIVVGDILRFRSNTAYLIVADYRHGWVATVTDVTGTVVTVDRPAYAAFTVDNVDIYSESNGVTITRLHSNQTLPSGGAGSPAYDIIGNNVVVQGCKMVGNQYAAIGINILGSNLRVSECSMYGFLNKDGDGGGGRTGYGSQLFGNDLVWENCVFVDCKHGQATGSRSSVDINARVQSCYFYGTSTDTLAQIDTHAGLLNDFIVKDCYVESYERAINVRNGRAQIEGCTFVKNNASTADSNVFISFFETELRNVSIRNNRFLATGGNVLFTQGFNVENPTLSRNLVFENNEVVGARVLSVLDDIVLTNCVIRNNTVDCPTYGLIRHKNMSMSNICVEGNTLGVLSILADASTLAYTITDFTLHNNKITLGAGTGMAKYTSDLASLFRFKCTHNIVDATGITAGEYILNFGQLTELTDATISDNVFTRGAVQGIRFFGDATDMPAVNRLRYERNKQDCQINISDVDFTVATFAENIFTNDTSGTPSIVMALNINTPTYDGVRIVDNEFYSANTTTTPVISIQGAITYTNPLRISNNTFHTAADAAYAVVSNAASVGNLIEFTHNTARRGFLDQSSSFSIIPVNNYIYGVNPQRWKGDVDIDPDNRFILSTAPATGDWARGDVVYRSAPSASGYIGFVCTTAGTPGTWKDWGAIVA